MSKNKETYLNKANDCFDNDIFLALFRKGAHEYLENDLLGDLPDSDDTSRLSEICNKKIKNMIKQAIRKEKRTWITKRLPRIAVIVLVVLAICSATVMSVEALRVPFLNLFINSEERKTDIEFNKDQAIVEDESFAVLFEYIPKGYELVSEEIEEQDVSLMYLNSDEETIFIDMYYGGSSISLDTEDAEHGEIKINGEQGFYSYKDGLTMLVFSKNEYVYSITASIELEEVIRIAENIK